MYLTLLRGWRLEGGAFNWFRLAPAVFLLLWSAGFAIAKMGLAHAEPITFLAVRYALVLAVLAPLALVLRPPLPRMPAVCGHLVVVGFLIQAMYFGLVYLSMKMGISADVLCAAGALVGITAGTLYEKRFGVSVHPVTSNLVQYAVGLAATLPVAWTFETMHIDGPASYGLRWGTL